MPDILTTAQRHRCMAHIHSKATSNREISKRHFRQTQIQKTRIMRNPKIGLTIPCPHNFYNKSLLSTKKLSFYL